jgi:hypothetical protein
MDWEKKFLLPKFMESAMSFEYPQAFLWTERLIAFAVFLQTLEMIQIRKSFSASGIWSWKVLREDFQTFSNPVRFILDLLLEDRRFVVLLGLNLFCATLALVFPTALGWGILVGITLLIAARWRGTFNGGSDSMTLIVLGAVFIGRIGGEKDARFLAVAMGYIAVQLCLSYVIAGVAKLRRPAWRTGEALFSFLDSEYYSVPSGIRRFAQKGRRSPMAPFAAWLFLSFEILFPVALLGEKFCVLMVVMALFFHAATVWAMGLNRFWWVWISAYPSLFWTCQYLQEM